MNKSKSSMEHTQLVQTINADLITYRGGDGPPGQVFMVPRVVLIVDFDEDAEIPTWAAVAEQILRAKLEIRGIDPGTGRRHAAFSTRKQR